MFIFLWLVGAALLLVAGYGAILLGRSLRARRVAVNLGEARALFHVRREWLEAHFLTQASQSGRPRGLSWANCDFEDAVSFARDRTSGELRALVGVAIGFEAIEGGGMEDNPNVGNLRAATAVFRYDGKQWEATSRPVMNLNPSQTIDRYQHELEVVE